MKRVLTYSLLIAGVLIGIIHLKLGAKAIFVFRSEESIFMWIFVLCGPLSTLPAVIVAYFLPKVGAVWLIVGSLLSFAAAVLGFKVNMDFESLIWYFINYSAPMLLLGLAVLLREYSTNSAGGSYFKS